MSRVISQKVGGPRKSNRRPSDYLEAELQLQLKRCDSYPILFDIVTTLEDTDEIHWRYKKVGQDYCHLDLSSVIWRIIPPNVCSNVFHVFLNEPDLAETGISSFHSECPSLLTSGNSPSSHFTRINLGIPHRHTSLGMSLFVDIWEFPIVTLHTSGNSPPSHFTHLRIPHRHTSHIWEFPIVTLHTNQFLQYTLRQFKYSLHGALRVFARWRCQKKHSLNDAMSSIQIFARWRFSENYSLDCATELSTPPHFTRINSFSTHFVNSSKCFKSNILPENSVTR